MCNRFCSIGFHCFPIKSQLSHQISWRSLLVPLSFHQQFDARLFGGSHQFFEVLHCMAIGGMSKRHQMDDQMFCVMFTKRGFLMFPDVYEICQTYYHDIIMLSSCYHGWPRLHWHRCPPAWSRRGDRCRGSRWCRNLQMMGSVPLPCHMGYITIGVIWLKPKSSNIV